MVYKKSFEVMKKCFFVFKTGLVIFLLEKGGGNSEIVTSRSRFFLVNVMERDEGGWGGSKT